MMNRIKTLRKPSPKKAIKTSLTIMLTSIVLALVITGFDAIWTALVSLIL